MLFGLLLQSTTSLEEIILTAPCIAESQLNITRDSRSPSTQALTGPTIDAAVIILAAEDSFIQSQTGDTTGWHAKPIVAQSFDGNGEPSGGSYKCHGELLNRNDKNAFTVPAQPWTKLTTNDALVSHLVTVFLNYNNVYWQYVGEDLLLHSMQRGLLSDFCSPLLVNAICTLACLSSEHSAAFMLPDDLMSRGEHFHKDALRL
jgi:hypothetical protein